MSTRRSLVLLAFAFLLVTAPVFAGVGFQPVSPDELKMTSDPAAPGVPAIILYREVARYDDRVPHEDNYFRIKILKEEGRKYGDIEIPFYKERDEDISGIKARTIRPDGTIAEFHGQVFEKFLVKRRGDGRILAKTFTLPEVEVGSIIEYEYTVDLSAGFVYSSHWLVDDPLFTKRARFYLKPHDEHGFTLRWSWQGLPAGVVPKQENEVNHPVKMEVSNIPAFQTEDFMPPEDGLRAQVEFFYSHDEVVERDPDRYWKAIGKQRNGRLESFIDKRHAMEDAVAQIVSPNDAPEVKLRKIYDRVQQFRNKSYELQKTQQELARDKEKPIENVEELWKRGYGSGAQLTWLYLALVRATGIEAYGCLVADRRRYFFDPKLMQGYKLDANVVLVKLNGKDLYFDPGAAFTPYGYLTWSETGVPGLRLDKDGGSWIETTLPESRDSQIKRESKLTLQDDGDLNGNVTVTYTGLAAMYQRLDMRHADEVARKKFLEDELKAQIPVGADADLTNKPDWNGSEAPLVAEFDLKVPGWAASAGKRATVPAAVFTAREHGIFEHAERVYPIYFEYPYEKIDDVTIALPTGWQVSSVPAAQTVDKKVVAYTLKAENNSNTLHLTRKLDVDAMLIEQKYYPALQHFFQAVRNGDEEQVVLQPGTSVANN
jgi:hypothetical protein